MSDKHYCPTCGIELEQHPDNEDDWATAGFSALRKERDDLRGLLQRAFEFGCLIPHPPCWVKEAESLLANTEKETR